MFDQALEWMTAKAWMPEALVQPVLTALFLIVIICVSLLAYAISYRVLLEMIHRLTVKTKNQWDDALMRAGVFRRATRLFPLLLAYVGIDRLLVPFGTGGLLCRMVYAVMILMIGQLISAMLQSAFVIYSGVAKEKHPATGSYVQAINVVLYIFVAIFMVASLLGKSPWGLLSVLGGLTAVFMLVFKDTILGFVAGVQLSVNDMIRVGDWIEMPSCGADGDVIDVSLNTVKVQNWDKTISTIPPYALISGSFKNWRGMSESGGRRIKRSVNLDIASIRFIDDELLARLKQIELLAPYLAQKSSEIDADNQARCVNATLQINGRQQTNVGAFRAYLEAYLRQNGFVSKDLTFLVRQLQSTAEGLPLEIYVFSTDKVWANYEAIQADVFDHIFASLATFDLRIFQNPTGADFKLNE